MTLVLDKETLQVKVCLQNPPWTYLNISKDGLVVNSEGIAFSFLDVLGERLNFTYMVVVSKSKSQTCGQ